jgi:hypothetical protein
MLQKDSFQFLVLYQSRVILLSTAKPNTICTIDETIDACLLVLTTSPSFLTSLQDSTMDVITMAAMAADDPGVVAAFKFASDLCVSG